MWKTSNQDKAWDSGCKAVKECGLADDQVPSVYISLEARARINALMDAMNNDEWLAYLIGVAPTELAAYYLVNDLHVPEQEVTSTTVDVDAGNGESLPANVIGTIHSHHHMGAFLSGTDHTYVGSNHDVTIVASTNGWKPAVKVMLPCGHYKVTETKLVNLVPHVDTGAFVAEAKSRIKKKTYQYTRQETPYYRACIVCNTAKSYAVMKWGERAGTKGWICDDCAKVPEDKLTKKQKKLIRQSNPALWEQCQCCQTFFPGNQLEHSQLFDGDVCPECLEDFAKIDG